MLYVFVRLIKQFTDVNVQSSVGMLSLFYVLHCCN